MSKPRTWCSSETIGFAVLNPRPVHVMPIPEDATPEQIAELERLIEEENKRIEEEESSRLCGS